MALLGLRRFSTNVYKDKTGADTAQIPATATLNVYKQGVTINGSFTVTTAPSGVLVTYYNRNRLADGDQLQVETDNTKTLVVVATLNYPTNTQAWLKSTAAGSINLSTGQRLVITNNQPVVYADDQGAVSIGSAPTTAPSTGLIEFYIAESFFDYILTGSGVTSQLFRDVDGGWGVSVGATGVNARNHASIQAACDYGGPGSRIWIPAGIYTPSSALRYDKGLTPYPNQKVVGEVPGGVLLKDTTATTTPLIWIKNNSVFLENLDLEGPNSGDGSDIDASGHAIAIHNSGVASVAQVELKWIDARKFAGWGIYMPVTAGLFAGRMSFYDCTIWGSTGQGSMRIGTSGIGGANELNFHRCQFSAKPNGTYGAFSAPRGTVHLTQSVGINFYGGSFQNVDVQTNKTAISFGAITRNVNFNGVFFETHSDNGGGANTSHWITSSGNPSTMSNIEFNGCNFFRINTSTGRGPAIYKNHDVGRTYLTFRNCFFDTRRTSSVETDDIVLNNAGDKIILADCIILRPGATPDDGIFRVSAPVGAYVQTYNEGTVSGSPDAPRSNPLMVTGAQRTAMDTSLLREGSAVWDRTDHKLYSWTGSAWQGHW